MKVVEFDYDRMQKTAESGFMNAWAAATYLVERGVSFRVAHEQIGKAVQLCVERNCELQDIELHELQEINIDRKSTRLNSSHGYISYAVFCLKKKKKKSLNIITS